MLELERREQVATGLRIVRLHETDDLPDAERLRKDGLLRRAAHASPDRELGRVTAEHEHGAPVGAAKPQQDRDRGALAGPVRPEHHYPLAALDDEVEGVERPDVAERLGDCDRDDHRSARRIASAL